MRALLLVAIVAAGVLPGSAGATFAGKNGRLLVLRGSVTPQNVIGPTSAISVNPNGSDPVVVDANVSAAAWSPDGTRLLVSHPYRACGGACAALALGVANDRGTILSTIAAASYVFGETWTADGAVAYVRAPNCDGGCDSGFCIWRANADGGAQAPMRFCWTYEPGIPVGWYPDQLEDVRFSPDGTRLVGIGWRPGAGHGVNAYPDLLVVADLATGARTVLTQTKAYSADWSPDSSRIVFAGRDGISTIAADGRGERVVRDSGAHPIWSPDGRRIAFADHGVAIMDADGSNALQATHDEEEVAWSWQPAAVAAPSAPAKRPQKPAAKPPRKRKR